MTNEIMTTEKMAERTMDSREIAELLGSRHADIIRSIESQLPKVGYTPVPYTSENSQNGQEYKYYRLQYRETMILVSGYSVELRAKVIDRWLELEKDAAGRLPRTFAEALRLAADQALEIEQKNAALAIAAPKAEFYDAVTESSDTIDIGEVAKVLAIPGFGRNKLFEFLRENQILMPNNQPYQKYIDYGYFRTIEVSFTKPDGSTHINIKTVVYQRGLDFIQKLVIKNGVKIASGGAA